MAPTRITDVIVPEIFSPYVQQRTTELTALIQSGVMPIDAQLNGYLAGGGLTFNMQSWEDLANEDENVADDNPANNSSPGNIVAGQEICVRLSRNHSWSSMRLAAALAGDDPFARIADLVAGYRARRLQAAFISTMMGVFADNAAAAAGDDTHVQNDMTVDISASAYSAGVTNFGAEAFIDAAGTLGDGAASVGTCLMHSTVFARAQKNNLIDFIPDARGEVTIPTFLGRRVIQDDGMPNPAGAGAAQTAAGIYHTWLLGAGAVRLGSGSPAANLETEIERKPSAGTGSGQDILHNRWEWIIHPTGYAYVGTSPNGGPSNAATTNNLAHAGSWSRRWPERKQIKIARLITREDTSGDA